MLPPFAESWELRADSSKALHKILPRHLPYFAVELQLEEGGENF